MSRVHNVLLGHLAMRMLLRVRLVLMLLVVVRKLLSLMLLELVL